MRSVIVTVLIFELVNCAFLNFSENDLHNSDRFRFKPNSSQNYLGSPKDSRKGLLLSRREVYSDLQKKRCELCRETKRCKVQGKCDLCNRFCKNVDTTTTVSHTEGPLLGNIQAYAETDNPTTPSQNDVTSFEKSGRYYTVGMFGPGPKQNLIARLLNISKKNKLDKLVVLAKAKGKTKSDNSEHPVIIDAANVFNVNESGKEVDANIYPVDAAKVKATDLDLTARIDHEVDMAIQQKKKLLGNSHLTKEEMDKVLDHALTLFNRKVLSPPSEMDINMAPLDSRSNFIDTSHLTTKRSVPAEKKAESNNTNNTTAEVQQYPITNFESQNRIETSNTTENDSNTHNQEYQEIKTARAQDANQILESKPFRKSAIITKLKDVGLAQSGGRYSQNENNYKGNPYLIEEDCGEDEKSGVDEKDYDYDSGEDLVEYEPRPPKYTEVNEQQYDVPNSFNSVQYAQARSQSIPETPLLQKIHQVISIPNDNKPLLESASQHVENRQYRPFKNSILIRPTIFQRNIQTRMHTPTPQLEKLSENIHKGYKDAHVDTRYESDQTNSPVKGFQQELEQEVTTTTIFESNDTQPEPYEDGNSNVSSNPIVGAELLEDPIKRRSSNIQAETQKPARDNASPESVAKVDEKEDELQGSESKTNNINASLFTLILKNLEKKVENIADLVKKTCGKVHPETEKQGKNIGHPNLIFAENRAGAEKNPVLRNHSGQKFLSQPTEIDDHEDNVVGNQIQIIEVPDNDTTNIEIITTTPQTEEIVTISEEKKSEPPILNVNAVVDELHKGHKFLLDKALNMADIIQGTLENPKQTSDRLLSSPKSSDNIEDAPSNINRGLFLEDNSNRVSSKGPDSRIEDNGQDDTVGCSKESSEEYVGNTNGGKLLNVKDTLEPVPKYTLVHLRSGFTPEIKTTPKTIKSEGEEVVGYSEEESDKYLDKQQIEPTESKKQSINIQNPDIEEDLKHVTSVDCVDCITQSNSDWKSKESQSKFPSFPQKSKSQIKPDLQTLRTKVDGAKQNKNVQVFEDPKFKRPTENSKDVSEEEKVGCSEEESEEYVGKSIKENKNDVENDNKAVDCNEKEGCLPYSSSNADVRERTNPIFKNGPSGLNLKKPKPLLPAQGLNKLLRRNFPPYLRADSSNVPKNSRVDQNNVKNVPNDRAFEVSTSSNKGMPHHNPHPINHFPLQPQETGSPISDDMEAVRPPVKQNIPIQYSNNEQNPSFSSQSNKLSPPPFLEQRFADGEDAGKIEDVSNNGFHLHRPKNLPNWPKLPDLVGATATADNVYHQITTTAQTQNPFSIFGRVVPQLNNTEISFHHLPSNKVYFVGTGMQLPLNMRKHADGSYQLSVDVEKLCNTCSEEMCKKNSNKDSESNKNEKQEDFEEATLGMKEPPTTHDNLEVAETNKNRFANDQERAQSTQQTPKKIEILTMGAPLFRNRRFPVQLMHRHINKHNGKQFLNEHQANKIISEKSTNNELNFAAQERKHIFENGKELRHQSLFDLDHNSEHSELAKRSANHQPMMSSLKANNRVAKSLNFNDVRHEEQFSEDSNEKFSNPSQNYLGSLDGSLRKIDTNMKNYFNHRQKLENHYRSRNKFDLEHPDIEKDVAKQRAALVNNLLTWMKSIAVKDVQT